MEIENITATLLKQTLNAWRQTKSAPAELLALDILHKFGTQSPAERQIHLYDWVQQATLTRLQQQREVEERPLPPTELPTRQQVTAVLAADFSHNNPELEAWSALYHRYCIPIHMSLNDLAQAAAIVPRHFSRRIQTGLNLLVNVLRREEMVAHGRFRAQYLRRHLPPPDYLHLFGLDEAVAQLSQLLTHPDSARFISVEGIGGIGKTTIARAAVHHLAETGGFEDIAWISARQTWFTDQGTIEPYADPARSLSDIVSRLATQLGQDQLVGLDTQQKLDRLHPFLSANRILIVIDNLESVTDIDMLLPALTPLVGNTRFLLTSRQTISHYPTVRRWAVPPLSMRDSQALIESELMRRGRNGKLAAADMRQLYAIIGGMPLALKLVAAQMNQQSLADIIAGLADAGQKAPETLYTYIYCRAWRLLNDAARQLLLSLLPIAPDGDDIEWLRLMAGLPPERFDTALADLLDYSLLEVGGPPAAPLYRLHRLTVTFLQTAILSDWDGKQGSIC